MGRIRTSSSRKWFDIVRRKLFRSSSHRNTNSVVLLSNACSSSDDVVDQSTTCYGEQLITEISLPLKKRFCKEDLAATKIQAIFRGHLARRAYRALRSLVRLQALARGMYVRKQTRIALHCMQALVRLQIRVRASQLLGTCNN